MEKVVDDETANNYISVSNTEYISNVISSISFLATVQKGLNQGGGKKKKKRVGGKEEVWGLKTNGKEWKEKLLLCIQIVCT